MTLVVKISKECYGSRLVHAVDADCTTGKCGLSTKVCDVRILPMFYSGTKPSGKTKQIMLDHSTLQTNNGKTMQNCKKIMRYLK